MRLSTRPAGPFKSRAQRAWMYANHPDMAKRWEADTPPDAKLPERKAPKKQRSSGTTIKRVRQGYR